VGADRAGAGIPHHLKGRRRGAQPPWPAARPTDGPAAPARLRRREDPTMDTILNDLRHGFRALRKTPGLTAVAALSLGLGIAANTTIFSAVNALLLRPLPFDEPDRVVTIMATVPERGWDRVSLPFPDVADLRRESSSFEEIAAYRGQGVGLTGGERPERIEG